MRSRVRVRMVIVELLVAGVCELILVRALRTVMVG